MTSKPNRKEAVLAMFFVLMVLSAAAPSVAPAAAASVALPNGVEGNWSNWVLTLSANYSESAFCQLVPSDGYLMTAAVASNGTISLTGNGEEYWYLAMTPGGTELSCGEEGAGPPQYSEDGKYFATSGLGTYSAWVNPEDFYDQNNPDLLIYKNGVQVQNFTQTTGITYNNHGIVAMSPSGQYILLVNALPGGGPPGIQVLLYTASGTLGPTQCPDNEFWNGAACATVPTGGGPSTCDPFLGYVCTSSETSTSSVQSVGGTATCGPNQCLPPDVTIAGIPVLDLVFGIAIILLVLVAAYVYGRTKKKGRGGLSLAESSSRIL